LAVIMIMAVGVVMPIMVVMVAHECLASLAACRLPPPCYVGRSGY
jgi:hypothetical protein